MDSEKTIELLKYNISRFDHYYASINFKSSFLIIGNITIIGFLFNIKSQISNSIFYIHISLITVSLLFVLLAVKPYLKGFKLSNSVVFFGDISNMQDESFKDKTLNISEQLYIKDLQEQNIVLAKGLKRKFDYLNVSTIFFILNMLLFFFNLVYMKHL